MDRRKFLKCSVAFAALPFLPVLPALAGPVIERIPILDYHVGYHGELIGRQVIGRMCEYHNIKWVT